MKCTKLIHSCLIVEKDGKKALVDPGLFSWESGVVDPLSLDEIDYVLVTHAHADHLEERFARAIHEHSPGAVWYGTKEVEEKLAPLGIKVHLSSTLSDVRFIDSEHADLTPWAPTPKDHTSFVLFDSLLVSGDTQSLSSLHGADILAGAFTAPWGSAVGFFRMIEGLDQRPRIVIPLHDWHMRDEARELLYGSARKLCEERDILFLAPQHGVQFDIE